MATFGQLVSRVNTKLRSDRTDLTAQIGDAINDAIANYLPEMLWFQETRVNVASVIGVNTLATPSDFNFANSWLSFNYNNYPFALQKVSNTEFDFLYVGVNNYPSVYTYDSGSIYLYPTPDRAYTVLLRYYKIYAAFATDGSADGNTNDWLTYAVKLIESKALSYLWNDVFGDSDREAEYASRANDELMKLRRNTNNKKKTGRIASDESSLTMSNYYNNYAWR